MFAIGYGVAMIISILGGMVWDATQNPAFSFVPVAIAALFILVLPPVTDLSKRPA
jgi:CP family cyanate transporter-like MFS transporter